MTSKLQEAIHLAVSPSTFIHSYFKSRANKLTAHHIVSYNVTFDHETYP